MHDKKFTLKRAAAFILLAFFGGALILACGILQQVSAGPAGEYHYSGYLRNSYTVVTAAVLLLAGLLISLRTSVHPLLTGLTLISVYPLTALYEATFFKGSHNLIHFELAVYALFSIPAIAGAFIGRFVKKRMATS